MKSKITFLKLAFLLQTDNKFSEFDITKPVTYLVQFMAFVTLKTTDKYPFFASIRITSILMDLVPKNMEKPIKMTHPILNITNTKGDFSSLQSN
jgi:hypothetical protein